ncbi:WHG domain-containing protein [Kitasatospora sp. NBC_01250]|uniref:TetR/AcrR family transcriptional regulator n=1 Tax=unclassified Kitasatospora TaxID=2633591 RepID=UPI002E10AF21|nr:MULTISPECIES: TetR/AcrR family transcriptional regulator [unclassified Kitasatospora]WSJ66734.1 WHG domain-containing protein [Kitasatospora sp. NBC_01302]
MEDGRRRRNPRGQGGLLRDQLIEATARLLATMDRPETLTLRQVAREVGVAPASIYSHFPDLTALVEHVLKLRYDELGRLMNDAAAAATTPLAELVARCAAYVHWGVEHPGEYRTIIGGAMPEQLGPLNAHGAGEELLQALVVALDRADERDDEPATPEMQWRAGLVLWTGMHGLVSLYNSHGTMPWPALDELLARLLGLHTGCPAATIHDLIAGARAEAHTARTD